MKLIVTQRMVLDVPEDMQEDVRELLRQSDKRPWGRLKAKVEQAKGDLDDLIGDIEQHYGYDECITLSVETKEN